MTGTRSLFLLAGFLVLLSCGKQKHEVLPELKGPYQATRAIEGALMVGVTYPQFGLLIQNLSAELLLARDRSVKFGGASSELEFALNNYAALVNMYKDSSTVWEHEIAGNDDNRELPVIAKKYGASDAMGRLDYKAVRQTIWTQAFKVHEQNIAVVYGYPSDGTRARKPLTSQ